MGHWMIAASVLSGSAERSFQLRTLLQLAYESDSVFRTAERESCAIFNGPIGHISGIRTRYGASYGGPEEVGVMGCF